MEFIIPIIILLVIIFLVLNIRIVQQAKAVVVERLGAYKATWGVGLHFKIPFIERIAKTVSLKEQVVDFPPQPVITKDNVTMQIDTVIYFQITDPKMYTYGVEHPLTAIENLTATTLRNIIGDLELDQTLTSRDIINGKMRAILDEATDPWGIKVNRVELKNIIPPREILRADAQKQAHILEAEGEAQAILQVQQATAEGIRLLNEAGASEAVIQLKALEAFAAAADGKATKIIIPSEIQSLAGLAASLTELTKEK